MQADWAAQTLWRNRLGAKRRTQDNSPHIKLTLRQLAPDSETNSPYVVILHTVLKYAGKIINILKLYSPQLDINLADRFEHICLLISGLIICPRFPLKIKHIVCICVGDNWSAKNKIH